MVSGVWRWVVTLDSQCIGPDSCDSGEGTFQAQLEPLGPTLGASLLLVVMPLLLVAMHLLLVLG